MKSRLKENLVNSFNSDGSGKQPGSPLSKALRSINHLIGGFSALVYAALIALSIRTFAYEPFNIPSGSMLPTLLDHMGQTVRRKPVKF